MNNIEDKIARKLIETILADGLTISVNDGEETTLHKSTNIDQIVDAIGTTDLDWLYVYDNVPHRIGSIMLVWGNGTDLISDYVAPVTNTDRMDALCQPAQDFAETLNG